MARDGSAATQLKKEKGSGVCFDLSWHESAAMFRNDLESEGGGGGGGMTLAHYQSGHIPAANAANRFLCCAKVEAGRRGRAAGGQHGSRAQLFDEECA